MQKKPNGKRQNKMTPPLNIYEFKTTHQVNIEEFSQAVSDNSRKIREFQTPETPKKENPENQPKKKHDKQMISTF